MKIRNGFVSNSSSSSFVLLKSKLTKEEIEIFTDWLETYNQDAYDGYINETESAFFGEKDNSVGFPDELDESKIEWGD